MKRLLLLTLVLALAGCTTSHSPIGEYSNVEVKSKRTTESCGTRTGCSYKYHIVFGNKNTSVELFTRNENVSNLFIKGSIVDVSYSKKFEILEVEFPELQKGE